LYSVYHHKLWAIEKGGVPMTTLGSDANMGRELTDDAETIAISERAKQQIGAQAASSRAQLHGPAFFESFSLGPPSTTGANVATVHWREIE
jgi:hypothetical protein